MKKLDEPMPGVMLLAPKVHGDSRGTFVKIYSGSALAEWGVDRSIREVFYSTSGLGVVRGMHLQSPPHDHHKFVHCIHGRTLDVALDLRVGSPTFGRCSAYELSEENRHMVSIPAGVAHGFVSLTDGSILVYLTETEHSPAHDVGVHWDSFGFKWPLPLSRPIISDRDLRLPPLADFQSPFRFRP